jgi:acyl carrier protein
MLLLPEKPCTFRGNALSAVGNPNKHGLKKFEVLRAAVSTGFEEGHPFGGMSDEGEAQLAQVAASEVRGFPDVRGRASSRLPVAESLRLLDDVPSLQAVEICSLIDYTFGPSRRGSMSASEEIYGRVARVLAQALGEDEVAITPAATLQGELGAESIDFLDIVFRLEREFGIKIPQGELFPDSVFGYNPEFVREGRITDEGVGLLRSRMPYADLGDIDRDRRLGAVTDLFTVDFVARYVEWKLGQGVPGGSPGTSAVAARSGTPTSGMSVASLD